MPTEQEKNDFALRLRALLDEKFPLSKDRKKPIGPSELSNKFNLKYNGVPITVAGVQRWLDGKTIPKPDKLAVLAKWLSVDEHWLHYGSSPAIPHTILSANKKIKDKKYPVTVETLTLAGKLQNLAPSRRHIVENLIAEFYREKDKNK